LSALDRASEHIAVKAKHRVQIHDAQHQVINFANADHGSILIENTAAKEYGKHTIQGTGGLIQ